MLRPKTWTVPASGRMSPATRRSITVLPEPLPPMITSVSPFSRANDTPRSTSTVSKRFHSPWASMTTRSATAPQ